MPITQEDLTLFFTHSLPFQLKTLNQKYSVRSIEMMPSRDSPLYLEVDGRPLPLFVPLCVDMGITVLRSQRYGYDRIEFIKARTQRLGTGLVSVDIGANVGLYTRQCLSAMPYIARHYLYEPHPGNFEQLEKNLKGQPTVVLNKAGLGPEAGVFTLYLDPDTCGNYSQNAHAVPAGAGSCDVEIRSVLGEQERFLSEGAPILYRSDTRGSDEAIATAFDPAFWRSVAVGSIGLLNVADKAYDVDRFATLLDGFDHRVLASNPGATVSTGDVIRRATDPAWRPTT